MKAKLICQRRCGCDVCHTGSGGCPAYPDRIVPAETVIDHPDAWKLVRMGMAVPADEECGVAANMTEREMAVVQHAQGRVTAGIHPDDYEAYDAGLMTGYYPDGSHRPGPNATRNEGGIIFDDWNDSDG